MWNSLPGQLPSTLTTDVVSKTHLKTPVSRKLCTAPRATTVEMAPCEVYGLNDNDGGDNDDDDDDNGDDDKGNDNNNDGGDHFNNL